MHGSLLGRVNPRVWLAEWRERPAESGDFMSIIKYRALMALTVIAFVASAAVSALVFTALVWFVRR